MSLPYGSLSQWERYGLTTFCVSTMSGLGLAYPPVAQYLRWIKVQYLYLSTYLLVQAYQPIWLVSVHDVYQRFTYVDHTIQS